jgi:hypothetical protein
MAKENCFNRNCKSKNIIHKIVSIYKNILNEVLILNDITAILGMFSIMSFKT